MQWLLWQLGIAKKWCKSSKTRVMDMGRERHFEELPRQISCTKKGRKSDWRSLYITAFEFHTDFFKPQIIFYLVFFWWFDLQHYDLCLPVAYILGLSYLTGRDGYQRKDGYVVNLAYGSRLHGRIFCLENVFIVKIHFSKGTVRFCEMYGEEFLTGKTQVLFLDRSKILDIWLRIGLLFPSSSPCFWLVGCYAAPLCDRIYRREGPSLTWWGPCRWKNLFDCFHEGKFKNTFYPVCVVNVVVLELWRGRLLRMVTISEV